MLQEGRANSTATAGRAPLLARDPLLRGICRGCVRHSALSPKSSMYLNRVAGSGGSPQGLRSPWRSASASGGWSLPGSRHNWQRIEPTDRRKFETATRSERACCRRSCCTDGSASRAIERAKHCCSSCGDKPATRERAGPERAGSIGLECPHRSAVRPRNSARI
jgi:hypothetical protein